MSKLADWGARAAKPDKHGTVTYVIQNRLAAAAAKQPDATLFCSFRSHLPRCSYASIWLCLERPVN